jgi:TolB-like protein
MYSANQSSTSVVSTDPAPTPATDSRLERAAILACVERIVRSRGFRASKRNRRFLRRVVEMELDGKGGEVTGFLIGSDVFRRGASFDHVKDPIVRIEASKLRRDLEHYYLTAGRDERIQISIPKGGYRPHFEEREPEAADTAAASALDAAGLAVASVRVSGALAEAQPPLRARLADGLTQKGRLAVFVAPEPESALLDSDAVRGVASRHGTAYVLSGDAWQEDGMSCFVARLHDGATGRQLWSRAFRGSSDHVASQAVDEVAEAQRQFAATRAHAPREVGA